MDRLPAWSLHTTDTTDSAAAFWLREQVGLSAPRRRGAAPAREEMGGAADRPASQRRPGCLLPGAVGPSAALGQAAQGISQDFLPVACRMIAWTVLARALMLVDRWGRGGCASPDRLATAAELMRDSIFDSQSHLRVHHQLTSSSRSTGALDRGRSQQYLHRKAYSTQGGKMAKRPFSVDAARAMYVGNRANVRTRRVARFLASVIVLDRSGMRVAHVPFMKEYSWKLSPHGASITPRRVAAGWLLARRWQDETA
jgi:hypothetical protein